MQPGAVRACAGPAKAPNIAAMSRSENVTIRLAETEADVRACHPVMVQLRPHIQEDDFTVRVRRMRAEGYQLVALTEDAPQGPMVRAVAGFRFMETLHAGSTMYVDDLVTDAAARSRNYGAVLFDWLVAFARGRGCVELALDSGVQRHDAIASIFVSVCAYRATTLPCRLRERAVEGCAACDVVQQAPSIGRRWLKKGCGTRPLVCGNA